VQHQEIIVQQPCPPPNGTEVLVDFQLIPQYHVLDSSSSFDQTTTLALVLTSIILFFLTFILFVCNCSKTLCKKRKKY